MTKNNSAWIQTFSGKKFHFLDPQPDEINIVDIAHALSMTCRFGGHCTQFYSVSEHSWRASLLVDNKKASQKPLWALIHDSQEAYIHDICRPIKYCLPEYKEIEEKVLKAIADKFNLSWPMPPEVKEIDNILLVTERRDLMLPTDDVWLVDAKPLKQTIVPYTQQEAKRLFLERFNMLFFK